MRQFVLAHPLNAMPDSFDFDVFLSHSSKDKPIVRPLAERLRADGVKVWFDEWVLELGDPIQKKIDDGLEESRVLVLCMSANSFGSDWAHLEGYTFRFRDPLNKERRFIPLRLDDAPIKGSLAQFLYINWLPANREREYRKFLAAVRSPAAVASLTIRNGNSATTLAELLSGLTANCTKARALQIEDELFQILKDGLELYLTNVNQYVAPAREAMAVVGGRILHSGIRDERVIDALRNLTCDPDKWVRKKAIDGLRLAGQD